MTTAPSTARARPSTRARRSRACPTTARLDAVDAVRPLVPAGVTMAQFTLRWILMWDAVSCAIPGARTEAQARENAAAADLPPVPSSVMTAMQQVYDDRLRPIVHDNW